MLPFYATYVLVVLYDLIVIDILVLVLMPHFLQCCLLYHLVNIMFEFIKPYMFLFFRSLPQIYITNGCKKNPSSSHSMHQTPD